MDTGTNGQGLPATDSGGVESGVMHAASDAMQSLPTDAEALRALLLATLAERDELAAQNDKLRHLLLKLKRLQFGQKAERLPEEQ